MTSWIPLPSSCIQGTLIMYTDCGPSRSSDLFLGVRNCDSVCMCHDPPNGSGSMSNNLAFFKTPLAASSCFSLSASTDFFYFFLSAFLLSPPQEIHWISLQTSLSVPTSSCSASFFYFCFPFPVLLDTQLISWGYIPVFHGIDNGLLCVNITISTVRLLF